MSTHINSENNILNEYNIKKKAIHKYILYIYQTMEDNIKNRRKPFNGITILDKINNDKDRHIVETYLERIYYEFEEYLYSVLFNVFGLDNNDSGDNRRLLDFNNNYILDKIYYVSSTNSELFKIFYKNYNEINSIQNKDQNNPLSNP